MIKFKAEYLSWCDDSQKYIECAFPVTAINEAEAERKAEQTLQRMEFTEQDFSYINLSIGTYSKEAA